MTGLPGPALSRRRVRTQLTRLRRQHGRLTDAQISTEMGWSVSKTRRVFSGDVSISHNDLRQLLTLLGPAEPDQVSDLLDLARQARKLHWAALYRPVLSVSQMEMLGWEDDAARVIQFHPYLLPDLVRTEDYARAALAADPWHRGDLRAIDERVAALMARQKRVDNAGRCVTVLVDARALPDCDSQMMCQQRDQLKTLPPHIDLRILPRDRAIASCLYEAITMHEFHHDPPAVYVSGGGGDVRVIEEPDLTASYSRLLTRLYRHSHPPP